MADDTIKILVRARSLIAEPEHWLQRRSACDATGALVDAEDQRAVKFCSVGAVWAVSSECFARRRVYACLEQAIGCPDISNWNDDLGRTHSEVIAAFDRAVSVAEAARKEALMPWR